MREIKFRIWDLGEHRWLSNREGSIHKNNANSLFSVDEPFIRFSRGDVVPQQFTGLKDKNGKEIYEGDITSYGEVAWIEQSASFRINPSNKNKDISFTESFANIYDAEDLEVIGNIYENPELLN